MKIIVGLGNPGAKYKDNRHNVGYMVLDKLHNLKEVRLSKSDTFMNESGIAVKKALNFYKLGAEDLVVIHDDLDIKLGEFKIQMACGPRQHNGVVSVEQELGTKDFLRVRVGVDNRSLEPRTPGEKYVLEDFTEEERAILDGVIEKIVDELKVKYAIK